MKRLSIAFAFPAIIAAICLGCSSNTDSSAIEMTVKNSSSRISHRICIHLPYNYDADSSYPVIYLSDSELFQSEDFIFHLDSLTQAGAISPVIVISTDSMGTDETGFFIGALKDKVEERYKTDDRVFCGNADGADFGIQLSTSESRDMFKEYWCFNPTPSNVSATTLKGNRYRVIWNLKHNTEAYFDTYPQFIYSMRKRGATIIESTYDDYENLPSRITEFLSVMREVFPARN